MTEHTYLYNCRIADPASGQVWKNGLLVLEHGDAAPDPIGYCGALDAPDAPQFRGVDLPEGDNPLDMEGATLLPGLIDFLPDIRPEEGPVPVLESYRTYAQLLRYGVTGCGYEPGGSTAAALCRLFDSYRLWGPRLLAADKSRCRQLGFAIFCGLPQSGSREEGYWLEQAAAAKAAGLRPVLASTGSPAVAEGIPTVASAAKLLVQAGYPVLEALRAVSVYPAQALGFSGSARLKAGMEGDVVAFCGNPLEDISALEHCVMSARGGRLIWSGLKGFCKTNFALLPPGYSL